MGFGKLLGIYQCATSLRGKVRKEKVNNIIEKKDNKY